MFCARRVLFAIPRDRFREDPQRICDRYRDHPDRDDADWVTTDRRFDGATILFTAIDDPFEHPHVLAEARPEEFSIPAFAGPIHIEDERRVCETFSDTDPMPEIIADIVSAERQHRHRIAANFSTAPVAAAVVSDAMVAPR